MVVTHTTKMNSTFNCITICFYYVASLVFVNVNKQCHSIENLGCRFKLKLGTVEILFISSQSTYAIYAIFIPLQGQSDVMILKSFYRSHDNMSYSTI